MIQISGNFPNPSQALDRIVKEWRSEAFLEVTNEVKLNLSGRVLKVGVYPPGSGRRGGRLRQSIDLVSRYLADGFEVGTNVLYGIAWEKGIRAHDIFPRRAKALRFKPQGSSQFILRKKAHIPAQAPRPFISKAVKDKQGELFRLLESKASVGLKQALPNVTVTVTVSI